MAALKNNNAAACAAPADASRWVDRIGAALVSPRRAMVEADRPDARGRASSDIALLLFVALVARETHLFATIVWLLVDHEWAGAFSVLIAGARDYLVVSVVLLLAGTVCLSILAGRRRSVADDFDLLCVALTPLVVLELANAIVFQIGVNLHPVAVIIGYGWFGLLWVVSFLHTRTRELPS